MTCGAMDAHHALVEAGAKSINGVVDLVQPDARSWDRNSKGRARPLHENNEVNLVSARRPYYVEDEAA